MSSQPGRHRRRIIYPWTRGFIPGYAPWSIGRVIPGAAGLVAFWITVISIAGVAVLAIFKPEILTDAAVTSAKLKAILIFVIVLGISLLVSGIQNVKSISKDDRFKKSRIGISLLIFALLLQVMGFGVVARGVELQRQLITSLFVDPASLADDSGIASAQDVKPLKGQLNILLLGGDAGENRWGLRPDSISVANIDLSTGRIVMIGIPRNLQKARFTEDSPMHKVFPNGYDCGNTCLINAIYTYAVGHTSLYSDPKYVGKDPGVEAMISAVEGTLGLTIDNYVLIDMMGFAHLVDAVGGVDINVPRRVVTQFGTVYEPGCQHMTGRQALLFARTRKDSNDYNRMSKQRIVQEALMRQTSPLDLLKAYTEIAIYGSQYIKTDMPENVVSHLLRAGMKSQTGSFASLELVPPTISTVDPDIESIHKMVALAIESGAAPKSPQGFTSPAPTTNATHAPISATQKYAKTTPCG